MSTTECRDYYTVLIILYNSLYSILYSKIHYYSTIVKSVYILYWMDFITRKFKKNEYRNVTYPVYSKEEASNREIELIVLN